MGLWDRVLRAVKLDPTLYKEVSGDDSKTTEAMLVVAIAAGIGGLGPIISPVDFRVGTWIASIILAPTLGLAIGSGVLWLIGKLFSGRAQFIEMFRPLGYAYAPSALGIVPFIGGLVGGIWSLVCAVIAVRESEEVTTGAAAAIVLIPAAVVFVLALIVAAALVATFVGFSNG
jgi:hypothetical protein